MLSKLKEGKKVVGAKQVKKAIEEKCAKIVFLAKDADEFVVKDIIEESNKNKIEIFYVDSMEDLGLACKIDVSAATAALLK